MPELRRISDSAALGALIADARGSVIVLVDVCRIGNTRLRHEVEAAVAASGVRCDLVWADPCTLQQLACTDDVCAGPTILLFVDGKIVAGTLGGAGVDALAGWIQSHTSTPAPPVILPAQIRGAWARLVSLWSSLWGPA
jgi:thioredoxin-like negative regulator of GroEL